jgi:hypothetical protein
MTCDTQNIKERMLLKKERGKRQGDRQKRRRDLFNPKRYKKLKLIFF